MVALLLTLTVAVSDVGWAPNVPVARSYAEKTGKPIVVALLTGSNVGTNLTNCVLDPKSAQVASRFVYVNVNSETKLRAVAKIKEYYDHTTTFFVEPNGKLLCRVGGYMTQSDFAEAAELALWAMQTGEGLERHAREHKPAGQELAQLGLLHAIRGEVDQAKHLLTEAEKAGASRAVLSSAYYGIGTQYRAAWKFKDAIPPLLKSLSLAKNSREMFRARLRLSMCYFRVSDLLKAKSAILPCRTLAGVSQEDRDFATLFHSRIQYSIENAKQQSPTRR